MANDLYFSHIWQKSNLGQFGCRVLESGDSTPAGEYFHTIRPLKNSSFTADNNTTAVILQSQSQMLKLRAMSLDTLTTFVRMEKLFVT